MFNFLKKKKESKELIVQDFNAQLPDIQKISVPDLKQYLLNGYEEIRREKIEKEKIKQELQEAQKYNQLYEGALVTLDEFRKRDEENKEKIQKLENNIEELQKEKINNFEIYNDLKIKFQELQNEKENNEKIILEKMNKAVMEAKNKIINNIQNTKGNISKSKVCDMIKRS